MRLGWNRDEDGVITIFAYAADGRGAPVADFWIQPIIEKFGMNRHAAKAMQEEFAVLLVTSFNKHFTASTERAFWSCPIGHEGCTKNCGNYCCGN